MNRQQKRTAKKKDPKAKAKYSLHDVQKAINVALAMKKFSKGHLFSKNQKELCVFCGASQKTKKPCNYWFMTFLDRMQTILINPDFFRDDEVQALWLQHEEEYQNIKLPLNFNDETKAN